MVEWASTFVARSACTRAVPRRNSSRRQAAASRPGSGRSAAGARWRACATLISRVPPVDSHCPQVNSRRRLPHIYPRRRWLFVTWSLHGSLPVSQYPPPHHVSAGQAFVWIDRYLDCTRNGPVFLRQEPVAALVADAIVRGIVLGHYQLGAFVVMANHVHVLLLPLVPPSRLLKSLKGYTAREANRLLGRTGQPFWQRESYDHWVRNGDEWRRIAAYIENNPVKAGVEGRADDYRWSSANERWKDRAFTRV
jgi:REP-associated tyrosine transposase